MNNNTNMKDFNWSESLPMLVTTPRSYPAPVLRNSKQAGAAIRLTATQVGSGLVDDCVASLVQEEV